MNRFAAAVLSGMMILSGASVASGQDDDAVVPGKVMSLFNGKDLAGWTADVPKKDKKPDLPDSFTVRDGMLVSLGNPRGHLVTDTRYREYRLVVEYRFPAKGGNCGVLVHSSTPRALGGMFPQSLEVQMFHGNAGDFWCIHENIEVPEMEKRRPRREGQKYGGRRGEARRILNLTDDSEKPLGEWNTMVIEASGRAITVWVNGDLVNNGFNGTADRGKIAIQAEGTEVEFRKLEIGPLPTVVPGKVSSLFNGKNLHGWSADVPARDKNPAVPDSFTVRDGMLVSLGRPGGHLVTSTRYRDYRLVVEYRFPRKGGNCGVLVHASKPRALYRMFPQSLEVQMNHRHAGDFWCIHENIEVPDMEKRRPHKKGQKFGGKRGEARRILNLTDESENPLGEWNTMAIECRGRSINVWVNGDHVNNGFNCSTDRGKIAVQAEGTEVEFRKLEIGPLPK